MDRNDDKHKATYCVNFANDYRALVTKMFLLTRRNLGQTVAEILLACIFMGLLIGMRHVLSCDFNATYQIPRFRPQDTMSFSEVNGNITYYYPGRHSLRVQHRNHFFNIYREFMHERYYQQDY